LSHEFSRLREGAGHRLEHREHPQDPRHAKRITRPVLNDLFTAADSLPYREGPQTAEAAR
jgi:hypothetical protein